MEIVSKEIIKKLISILNDKENISISDIQINMPASYPIAVKYMNYLISEYYVEEIEIELPTTYRSGGFLGKNANAFSK